MPAVTARRPRRRPWPAGRSRPRPGRRPRRRAARPPAGRRDHSARPLLILAIGIVLGLAGPAAWRWCRRTSRTQVHRVNQ